MIDSLEWVSTEVRTGGPSGPLHQEWTLSVGMTCEVPARGVAVVDVGTSRWHTRDWARLAEHTATLAIALRPHDWSNTDDVGIHVGGSGGIGVTVESAALKHDPLTGCVLDVEPGMQKETGAPFPVFRAPAAGVTVTVLMIDSLDTKAANTRWRVRAEHLAGLSDFSFLATGKRGGEVRSPSPFET